MKKHVIILHTTQQSNHSYIGILCENFLYKCHCFLVFNASENEMAIYYSTLNLPHREIQQDIVSDYRQNENKTHPRRDDEGDVNAYKQLNTALIAFYVSVYRAVYDKRREERFNNIQIGYSAVFFGEQTRVILQRSLSQV